MTDQEPTPRQLDERSIIDAVADLLQTIVDWLRQEAEAAVREKIVLPMQALGFTLFFGMAASSLMMAGALMISLATLLWLADSWGWVAVLYAIGGSLLALSAVAFIFRVRTTQK